MKSEAKVSDIIEVKTIMELCEITPICISQGNLSLFDAATYQETLQLKSANC